MPSKSAKQHRFMAMCAKNPDKARAKCPPKHVAEEFVHADKGRKVARKKSD
jgi:hypothetical protein